MRKDQIICLNLDTVKKKNFYQFSELRKHGYRYLVVGYQSAEIDDCVYEYRRYRKNLVVRAVQIAWLLARKRSIVHHVELYMGGGSFLGVEFLIAKVLGLKVCVVERGSPLRDLHSRYGAIAKALRTFVYRQADIVWIRELWMKSVLTELGRRDYFFLSNAISIPSNHSHAWTKPLQFAWCNSMKRWRNVEWFIDALSLPGLDRVDAVVLGFLNDNPTVAQQQDYVRTRVRAGVQLLPFQEPEEWFLKAKFFVLPADIVYLNFSLLEAMAHGVVPIVSDVEGANEIVDETCGFLAEHSRQGLISAMRQAADLDAVQYEYLSANARARVVERFSIERWGERLSGFYRGIR